MPVAMPLPAAISQSSTRRVKQRMLMSQFGNGYVQTAPDGTSSIYEEWDVSWENLTAAERTTVTTTLLQAAVDHLTWTPPNDSVEKKYIVMPSREASLYDEIQMSGQFYTITTSLRQVR